VESDRDLPISNAQTFALTDATALVPVNVKAAAAEYKGRKAVFITRDAPKTRDEAKDGFARLKDVDFQDGTIEGEIALKITAPPGPPGMRRSPGFVGIAFRARPDASHYDLFYLRPGNSAILHVAAKRPRLRIPHQQIPDDSVRKTGWGVPFETAS
jgi:hypothetical protein